MFRQQLSGQLNAAASDVLYLFLVCAEFSKGALKRGGRCVAPRCGTFSSSAISESDSCLPANKLFAAETPIRVDLDPTKTHTNARLKLFAQRFSEIFVAVQHLLARQPRHRYRTLLAAVCLKCNVIW
jgi:hypothetical protein